MVPTPLRLRVPRSPAVFVGRELELALVLERVNRGGVAVITGVGGLGKTALACRAVEALDATVSALFVGLRAGADVALEVGRALALVERFDAADWSVSSRDPEAMVGAVLELAESGGHVVVVDDLHEGNDAAEAFVERVAAHARRSRWIVTSRRVPRWAGSEELTVPLLALERGAIDELLASCAPHVAPEVRSAIAAAAAGSPWRARSGLRGGHDGERVAGALAGRERTVVALLAEVSIPVPSRMVLAVDGSDGNLVERLRRDGLIEVGEDAVRLHDVARAQLAAAGLPPPEPAERQGLIRALLASGIADLELEGLVLWRRHRGAPGDLDPVAHRATAWIEAGFAERAFVALDGVADPRLERERLVCATAVASEASLTWATHHPEPTLLDAKLAWATALVRAGHSDAARAAAVAVREASSDPDLATRAALIESEEHRNAGRRTEADRVLALAAPRDPGLRLLVEVRRARSLAMADRIDEALAACRAVAEQAWSRPPAERFELIASVAGVLSMLGRLREMRALTRRLDDDRTFAPFATRMQLAQRAVAAIEAGELAEGRGWLERMGSTRSTPRLHAHALLDQVRLRAAVGELDGIVDVLEELAELCERSRMTEALGWSRVADAHCGIILAEVRARAWPAGMPPLRSTLQRALDACVRMSRRRLGLEVDAAEEVPSREVDVELFRLRDRCEEALVARRTAHARRALSTGLVLARSSGYALHEADLLALGADLHAADGDRDRAQHFARELHRLGERIGSPRFVAEAALARAVSGGEGTITDLLESLARDPSRSPVATRRARALLGREDRLDAVDRLALLPRCPLVQVPHAAPTSTRSATWSFDATARRAELPGGRVVDLQKHALLARLVEVLRLRGQSGATKEELAREVWEVRDYHPLRDDKRVHVAVRRLRVLLEDDQARPTRLITTDRGYAVRGLEPAPP